MHPLSSVPNIRGGRTRGGPVVSAANAGPGLLAQFSSASTAAMTGGMHGPVRLVVKVVLMVCTAPAWPQPQVKL